MKERFGGNEKTEFPDISDASEEFRSQAQSVFSDMTERFPETTSVVSKVEAIVEVNKEFKDGMGKKEAFFFDNIDRVYNADMDVVYIVPAKGANVLHVGGKEGTREGWTVASEVSGNTLCHELGHVFYFKSIVGSSAEKEWDKVWKSRTQRGWEISVSKYASTSKEELFAESFTAYTHLKYGKSGNYLPQGVPSFMAKYIK